MNVAHSVASRASRRVPVVLCAMLLLACAGAAQRATASENLLADADIPFAMPEMRRLAFPDREYPITDHGAVGDGERLNTTAIQAAINACSQAGGGFVRVPAGRWLTGPIELKSGVNLHLHRDAVLVFTTDKRHYFGTAAASAGNQWAQHSLSPAELEESVQSQPLISAFDCDDIAITGEGTIDGQGSGWWPLHKRWWERFKSQIPGSEAMEAIAWAGLDREGSPQRPRMIQPIKCRNVLLEGFTALNGPFWMINPVGCENVIMRKLTVRAALEGPHTDTPNTDGINPESCRNVLVEDCTIDTGDDSIAIKSGRDEMGRQRGMPAENIVIRRVRGKRIAIGSEMSGGVRNILIRDCALGGENTLFHLKTRRGRGGVVENIWFENITGSSFSEAAIKVDMEYWTHVEPAPPEPVSERTPRIRNLVFSNVRSEGGTGSAIAVRLNGLPEAPLENVVLKDLRITAPNGIFCNEATRVRFENVNVQVRQQPAVTVSNSRDVAFTRLALGGVARPVIDVAGGATRDVRFDDTVEPFRVAFVLKDGASAEHVRFPDGAEASQ